MSQLTTKDYAKVYRAATKEAKRLKHAFLTPEHLLLGMMAVTGCDGCQFLAKQGYSYESLLEPLSNAVGYGSKVAQTPISVSLRALGIIHDAEDFAQEYDKPMGTLHLLWSLLQDDHCEATTLLRGEQETDPHKWAAERIAEIEEILAEPTTRKPLAQSFRSDESLSSNRKHWQKRFE